MIRVMLYDIDVKIIMHLAPELEELLHLKKRKPRKKKQVDMTNIGEVRIM